MTAARRLITAAVEVSAFWFVVLAYAGAIEQTSDMTRIAQDVVVGLLVATLFLLVASMVLEGRVLEAAATRRPGRRGIALGLAAGTVVAAGIAVAHPTESILGDVAKGLFIVNLVWAVTAPVPRRPPVHPDPAMRPIGLHEAVPSPLRLLVFVAASFALLATSCAGPRPLGWMFPGVPTAVLQVDFSPDGRWALTTYSADGCSSLWTASRSQRSTGLTLSVSTTLETICGGGGISDSTHIELDPPIDPTNPPHVYDGFTGHEVRIGPERRPSITAAQLAADGRSMTLRFAADTCEQIAYAAVDHATVDAHVGQVTLPASVRLATHGGRACSGTLTETSTRVELDPPVDPAHPLLVTDGQEGPTVPLTVQRR